MAYFDPATPFRGKPGPWPDCQVMAFDQLSFQAGGDPADLQCLLVAYADAAAKGAATSCPGQLAGYQKAQKDVEGCFSYGEKKYLNNPPAVGATYVPDSVNSAGFNMWQTQVNALNSACGVQGGGGGVSPSPPPSSKGGALLALALVGFAVWAFLRTPPRR